MGTVIEMPRKEIVLTEAGYLELLSMPDFRAGRSDRVIARQAAGLLRDHFGRTEPAVEIERGLLDSWRLGAEQ
jgi:hypothetical protein